VFTGGKSTKDQSQMDNSDNTQEKQSKNKTQYLLVTTKHKHI